MHNNNLKIGKLKGLGPKSEQALNNIGIYTRKDLEKMGPIKAFIKLREKSDIKPSLNLLYAMVGALEDKHWTTIAQQEKTRLLLELDGYQELLFMMQPEGAK
ncbi:TfoX/Sxy family protein [Kaarinaea lacus]